jgi:hypothetical protein
MPFNITNYPCVEPDLLFQQRPDAPLLYPECNSYQCPLGREVGKANILVQRDVYDRLRYLPEHTLTIIDHLNRTVTIPYLTIIQSSTVVQTGLDKVNSTVKVVLADRRWRWKLEKVQRQYNYRDMAGNFVTASKNGSSDWTWNGIVADLWGKLPTTFTSQTSAPTFPTTPAGTPEGFSFYGVGVWDAICRVCEAGGFVARYDGTTGRVDIVDPAADGPARPSYGRDALPTFDDGATLAGRYEKAAMPEFVNVSFPRPGLTTAYSVESATTLGTAGSGTEACVWDDMPAVGDPVSNTAGATNRAAAVRKLWELDWISQANPNRVEFVGWVDWVKRVLGYQGFARWAVYDRGSAELIGGVLSCVSSFDDIRHDHEPLPGAFQQSNEGGPTLDVVTNACLANVSGGYVLTVEYTPVTLPPGSTAGTPYCVTAPTDCCGSTWWCDGGVCTEVASGDTPPVGASGPYDTEAECVAVSGTHWYCVSGTCVEYAACAAEPADSTGPYASLAACQAVPCPTTGGYATCCSRNLAGVLYLSLSDGYGTVALVWDGTAWTGSSHFGGCSITFQWRTDCKLWYKCPSIGSMYITASCETPGAGGDYDCVVCTPPMSAGAYLLSSTPFIGCGCSWMTITGVVSE